MEQSWIWTLVSLINANLESETFTNNSIPPTATKADEKMVYFISFFNMIHYVITYFAFILLFDDFYNFFDPLPPLLRGCLF